MLRVCMRRLLQGPQAHPKNWIGGVLPDVSGGQTAARLLSGCESARWDQVPAEYDDRRCCALSKDGVGRRHRGTQAAGGAERARSRDGVCCAVAWGQFVLSRGVLLRASCGRARRGIEWKAQASSRKRGRVTIARLAIIRRLGAREIMRKSRLAIVCIWLGPPVPGGAICPRRKASRAAADAHSGGGVQRRRARRPWLATLPASAKHCDRPTSSSGRTISTQNSAARAEGCALQARSVSGRRCTSGAAVERWLAARSLPSALAARRSLTRALDPVVVPSASTRAVTICHQHRAPQSDAATALPAASPAARCPASPPPPCACCDA